MLRPRPLQLDPTQRRLSRALTIADLRTAAKRRTPRAVFDYTDGAAETETSLRRAREAFQRVEFRPRVLRDVTVVDTTTTMLGRPSALPLAFAPTGFTRMMHHQGERAVVRVAEGAGITNSTSRRWGSTASTWKQSAARICSACADRNCRQVSSARRGAGSMPARLSSSHTVLGATVYPSPQSSPWMRRLAPVRFSHDIGR
ncbi:MAG TPA: alpha-hydroxy-acid oxidizing protein, partial [Actinomycetes bacterium]|nr:alpha-hydroxy-acid oxidizing protein [Actinomycetes bacterium]